MIYLNGQCRRLEDDTTVAQLLEELGSRSERVAVELNLHILDKQDYTQTILKEGDRLEIISFVGGGGRCYAR